MNGEAMSPASYRIDVVICTRDRLHLLPETLQAIFDATRPRDDVRVVVVDNGSVDGTAEYLEHLAATTPRMGHIRESRPGIYHARAAAVEVLDADFLVFVDDDVIVEPDFLKYVELAFLDPAIGAVGGAIYGIHDDPLPPWYGEKTRALIPILPVRGAVQLHTYPCFPPGACLGMRRIPELAHFLSPERRRIALGHGGGRQVGGEDTDLCEIYCRAGYSVISSAALRVGHRVIPEKLTPQWLVRRFRQEGHLRVLMARLRGKPGMCGETAKMLAALPGVALMALLFSVTGGSRALILRAYLAKCMGAWAELLMGERGVRFSYPSPRNRR